MCPTAKGALAGIVAFVVTTIATIAATTLASGGEPAAHLDPLRPADAPQSTQSPTPPPAPARRSGSRCWPPHPWSAQGSSRHGSSIALENASVPVRLAAGTVGAQGRYLVDYLDFDTRPRLATTDIPVLAIWGAEDDIVPVNEAYRRLDAGRDRRLLAHIVPGLGHDMRANTEAWLPAVASWMREPDGEGIVGVEPAWDLGVAEVPPPRWHSDPRLHVAASILAAVLTAVVVTRRTRHRLERTAA